MANKIKMTIAATAAAAILIPLEGYSPPYYDSAGVLTDCFGNTKNVSASHVRSLNECRNMLDEETLRIANKIHPMFEHDVSVNSLAAWISFTYNVGDTAFKNSTALKLWNKGYYEQACLQMNRWVYITVLGVKVKLNGLVNRRKTEVEQCLQGLKS